MYCRSEYMIPSIGLMFGFRNRYLFFFVDNHKSLFRFEFVCAQIASSIRLEDWMPKVLLEHVAFAYSNAIFQINMSIIYRSSNYGDCSVCYAIKNKWTRIALVSYTTHAEACYNKKTKHFGKMLSYSWSLNFSCKCQYTVNLVLLVNFFFVFFSFRFFSERMQSLSMNI